METWKLPSATQLSARVKVRLPDGLFCKSPSPVAEKVANVGGGLEPTLLPMTYGPEWRPAGARTRRRP